MRAHNPTMIANLSAPRVAHSSPAPRLASATAPSPHPRDPARWLFWTLAAFLLLGWPLEARQAFADPLLRPGQYSPAWVWTIILIKTLGAITIVALAGEATRRMPLARAMRRADVLAHMAIVVACTVASQAFDALAAHHVPPDVGAPHGATGFVEGLVLYFVIAAAFQGVRAIAEAGAERARDAEERARLARATRRCAQSELRALRARISSRAVAATLAHVSTLARRDAAAAHRALAELGTFLRSAARQPAERQVTLRDELLALEPFVELERARLGGRLTVRTHTGSDALDALVPAMLLAPLLESALRAAAPPRDAVDVDISAARDEAGALAVVVRVTGFRGSPAPAPALPDDACAAARERLAAVHGAAGTVRARVLDPPEAGVEYRVGLPFETEESDPHERESAAAAHLAPPAGRRARAAALARRMAGPAARIAGTLLFFAWWTSVITGADQLSSRRLGVTGTRSLDTLDGLCMAAIITAMMLTAVRLSTTRPWWTTGDGRAARDYRALGVHLLAGAAFAVAVAVDRVCFVVLIGYRTWAGIHWTNVASSLLRSAPTYAILFVVFGAAAYALRAFGQSSLVQAHRNRSRARAAEAEARQAQLLLGALKAELNPHFLGNALQAAAALMERDAAAAELLLGHIAQLLAAAVAHSHTQEVPLARELEALAPFVAIEQARLGRAIQLQVDVPAPLRSAVVPHMILQPLVENAVKHGLAPSPHSARIVIAARSRGGMLELDVVDDGVGPVARTDRRGRGGQGMRNVRDRLEALYGPRAGLDLAPGAGGGAAARVRIPRRGARWGRGDRGPVGVRAAAVLP